MTKFLNPLPVLAEYPFIFKIFLISLFFLQLNILSQTANFRTENISGKGQLAIVIGEKFVIIDSMDANQGIYSYNFDSEKQTRGLYRLTFSNSKFIDFIYDNEEIDINISSRDGHLIPIENKSKSNRLYYLFKELNRTYKTKSELLQLIIARYPADDNYYTVTKERLKNLQQEYLNFIYDNAIAMPNAFISEYLKSAQLPVLEPDILPSEQLNYLRAHALDNVNFYDERLINSDLFANKSIEYLTYYRNPQLPLELLEKEFMSAVDTILNKAKVNHVVYTHVTEYLLDGFKKFGFDKVINYILENYVIKDDICLDTKLSETLDRRIQQSRLLKIGTKAPNIIVKTEKGETFNLEKSKSKRTLLVFYSTNCSHCKTMLPELRDFQSKRSDLNIVAIALETKSEEWLEFIKINKLNWTNVSDLTGWDGKAANDYFVYATPTMFLLDETKTIISKPMSIDELKQGLIK